VANIHETEQIVKQIVKHTEDVYKGTFKTLGALKDALRPSEPLGALAHTIMPSLIKNVHRWHDIWTKGKPEIEATSNAIASITRQIGILGQGLPRVTTEMLNQAHAIKDAGLRHAKIQASVNDLVGDQVDMANRYITLQENLEKLQHKQVEENKALIEYEKIRRLHLIEQSVEIAVIGTGLSKAVKWSNEFNRSLIQANSDLEVRGRLFDVGLTAQIKTGSSITETASMMMSLTNNAFKFEDEFKDVLKTSIQVSEGLGLSAEQTAKLARTAAILNQPFKQLADTMATILDNTRLTAAEAESMLDALGRSYIVIGGASRGALEVITRVEGELKKRTGEVGNVQRLVSSMAGTAQGAMLAQVFGLSPEALQSSGGVQTLLTRLAARVQQDTAGKTGVGRLQVLENISQQLTGGTMSTQALAKLAESMRDVNSQTLTRVTIEDRWRKQLTDTNAAVHRLTGSLEALIMRGFTPTLRFIRWTSSLLADVVGKIGGSETASKITVTGATIFLTLTAIKAGYRIGALAAAILGLGKSAEIATGQQLALNLGEAAGVGAGKGGGILRWAKGLFSASGIAGLGRLVVGIITTAGLIPIVVAGLLSGGLIYLFGRSMSKAIDKEMESARHLKLVLSHGNDIRSQFAKEQLAAVMAGPDSVRRLWGGYEGNQVVGRFLTGLRRPEDVVARLHTLENEEIQRATDRQAALAILSAKNEKAAKDLADLAENSREQLKIERERNTRETDDSRKYREELNRQANEREHKALSEPEKPLPWWARITDPRGVP